MKVVPLRQSPPLTDIVGRLRLLADEIESSQYPGAVESVAVLVCVEDDARPRGHFYGQVDTDRHRVSGMLLHAAMLANTDREDGE